MCGTRERAAEVAMSSKRLQVEEACCEDVKGDLQWGIVPGEPPHGELERSERER